jgi:hypothetical protein
MVFRGVTQFGVWQWVYSCDMCAVNIDALNYHPTSEVQVNYYSFGFKDFALLWMLYFFFWVILRCRVNKTYEDGTDRRFRNVGTKISDAGESPKRKNTTISILLWILDNSVVAYFKYSLAPHLNNVFRRSSDFIPLMEDCHAVLSVLRHSCGSH